MTGLTIKTASSIQEIDPETWTRLSHGQPFQSHRWYAYGEQVMKDCPPVYILAYQGDELVARAAFWLVRNEPIPKMPRAFRKTAKNLVKHWPPLICRSPLANVTGLILADRSDSDAILKALAQTAVTEAASRGASFTVFDYLGEAETTNWPRPYEALQFSDAGTVMQNHWNSLEEYLSASINKKGTSPV
jgi:predicted N-acyltransferase